VRRKLEASVQRAGLGCRCWRLMWVWAWPWLAFFLAEVGSSVVVSLRFAFSQNQGKGKALVFSCAGRGKSWVEKGEVGSVSSRGGNAEVREIGGQRRCGCSLFLWFFGRGRESLVCREMGRRLQWQRGGSLVSQREGCPRDGFGSQNQRRWGRRLRVFRSPGRGKLGAAALVRDRDNLGLGFFLLFCPPVSFLCPL
jgi:hypothetical protein